MKGVIKVACAAFGLLFFSAVPSPAADTVVARVGSEPITRMEVITAQARNPDMARDQVLESLIEQRLILSWAGQNDLTVSEEEVDRVERSLRENNNLTAEQFEQALRARGETVQTFRDGLREQILTNRALGTALRDRLNVSEGEIDQLYRQSFPAVETVTLRHILLKVDKEATDTEAEAVKNGAVEIYRQLQGGASFDAMVRRHSGDASSLDTGGRLGTFHKGELIPELETAVTNLAAGEVSEPVRTAAGFHIVLVESRDTEDPPPMNTVRDQLLNRLRAEKETRARNDWLREIREKAYIEVFDKSE
ncbi:MAG: peptidylprolyl isomerase [bacterium]|nr:peptidylprolyl isomerase [bacterium]MDT8395649.1 peptidylprolyl isomerase [bacterium]